MISELTILIIGLIIFFIIDSFGSLYSSVYLFFVFLFSYVNLEGKAALATFYLFASMFVIAAQFAKAAFAPADSKKTSLLGFEFRGFGMVNLTGIIIGILLFLLMRLMQGGAEGSIIGVPSLAIGGAAFGPLIFAYLGIIENRTFFTLYELMRLVPFFIFRFAPVLMFLVAGLFAIFHLTAYSAQVSTMLFAFIIMFLWLMIYELLRDTMAADTSHAVWNGVVSIGRGLSIT